jgi:1-phosphatidylinositol phosphodiesterase
MNSRCAWLLAALTACATAVPLDISWDLSALAGKPVTLEPSGAVTFDGIGDAGRAYLRTNKSDFHTAGFVAEVTVTVNGGGGPGCAFFGIGGGLPDPAAAWQPNTAPVNYLRLAPTDFGGAITLRDNAMVSTVGGGAPGNGTHRIRLIWDAATKRLQADVDHHHAGRVFARDSGILQFSESTGFNAGNARLFIGGAAGVRFGPLSVRAATAGDIATIDLTATRWMSALPGTLRLSRISIPGTHDSAARVEPLSGTAKCQDLSIADQLTAGIRYFDIRCRHLNNAFAIYHGSVDQKLTFNDVLNPIDSFLAANPNECVMMVVKEEHTPDGNTRTFAETFQSYLAANPARWWTGTTVPTLTDARGKIVLVRRFGGYSGGINATNWPDNTAFLVNNLAVEDQYVVPDNNVKWERILTSLGNAVAQTNANILHLTHTSGYRSGLFGIPSITTVSNNINPRIQPYFSGRAPGNHGCVIMDFANANRSWLILRTNFPPTQGPLPDGIYQIRAVHSDKVLELSGASTAAAAPAVQAAWSGGNHQRFNFTNLGGGDYRITALHSSLALEVGNSSTSNGALVLQRPYTGGANQIWNLTHNGDDSFRIAAKHSGLVIDVSEASTDDGATIHQWQWFENNNQRWHLTPVNRPPVFSPDPPPPVIRKQGQASGGSIFATDPDPGHSPIGFAKSGGPSWLAISPTGVISGTPPAGSNGTHPVTVLADDPLGAVSSSTLNVVVIDSAANTPVWGNPLGGSWGTATHWLSGVVASGITMVADFSLINLTADTTITLDGGRSIAGLRFGDTVPSHDWTLVPGTGGSLTLQSSATIPVIEVKNRTATLHTALSGSQGFTKSGGGTLTLLANSTHAGAVAITQGTLVIDATLTTGGVTVSANSTLGGNGSIGGALTCHGSLSPGHLGVGSLSLFDTLNLAPGSEIVWEISEWNGPSESGFDAIHANTLDLSATASNPVTLRVTPRDFSGFAETSRYFPMIRTNSGISGFDRRKLVIDATALPSTQGSWIPMQSGNDLVIAYVALGADENNNGIADDWEILHFGNADPGNNLPGDDPDDDGLPNLIEYALDTHPLVPNPTPITSDFMAIDGRLYLRLTIPKNQAATHLEYVVEASSDLSSWSTEQTVVLGDTPGQGIVRDDTSTDASDRRFMRLRVRAIP